MNIFTRFLRYTSRSQLWRWVNGGSSFDNSQDNYGFIIMDGGTLTLPFPIRSQDDKNIILYKVHNIGAGVLSVNGINHLPNSSAEYYYNGNTWVQIGAQLPVTASAVPTITAAQRNLLSPTTAEVIYVTDLPASNGINGVYQGWQLSTSTWQNLS